MILPRALHGATTQAAAALESAPESSQAGPCHAATVTAAPLLMPCGKAPAARALTASCTTSSWRGEDDGTSDFEFLMGYAEEARAARSLAHPSFSPIFRLLRNNSAPCKKAAADGT